MYFYCICGKEGDFRVLLFRRLLSGPSLISFCYSPCVYTDVIKGGPDFSEALFIFLHFIFSFFFWLHTLCSSVFKFTHFCLPAQIYCWAALVDLSFQLLFFSNPKFTLVLFHSQIYTCFFLKKIYIYWLIFDVTLSSYFLSILKIWIPLDLWMYL